MLPANIVGKTGRALTAVGSDGQVEIDGRTYEAVTFLHSRSRWGSGRGNEFGLVQLGLTCTLGMRLPGDTSLALAER